VVQQMAPGFFWLNGNHTNLLTYKDVSGNSYTNVWYFNARVPNNNVVWVPATQRVDSSQVDHSQPGLRVKAYQATAGGGGNINSAELLFLGGYGANLITTTPVAGYFVWTNPVDFADNIATNGSHGEYRYNYSFSNVFGATLNGGGGSENNLGLIFAGWFDFARPGMYAMTVNSDDGFKVTSPFGFNPFNEQGLILNWTDNGRGDTGGSVNPFNGSSTPIFFNIPQAGAYPFRLLYYNGAGGLAVEWTLIQPLSDGSVDRELIGDYVSAPDAVRVYQTLLTNPPTVIATVTGSTTNGGYSAVTNAPALVFGAQPQLLLGSELGFNAQTSSQLPLTHDFWVQLRDGSVAINTNSIVLSLNGVNQPITVTNGNGLTTLFRFATNGLWPSGAWAPIIVSFNDVNGNHYSYPVEYVETPFWGTLHQGYAESWADPNSPGFKVRAYQIDPAFTSAGVNKGPVTTGTLTIPNRVHISEQLLAGLWGPNQANLAAFTDFGYQDMKGTGPTNGVVNWNAQYPAIAGNDFQYSTAQTGSFTFNQPMPGLPGLGPTLVNNDRSNSVALEILAYVDFPTNGTYTLGVNSDDGFRVMQQWIPPADIAAVVVNSPVAVARTIPAVMNVCENTAGMSLPVTNPITGNLVLASGSFGASTNGEGCVINNGAALFGNIALLIQSKNGVCGINQQVVNAAAAGAQAVVLISKHTPTTDGVLPDEQTVSPMQKIPLVVIEESDGAALVSALGSGPVNVTLTPEDYQFNPPTDRVLGQTSVGKGNSDCNFTVIVTNAPGIYPLRLVYWNGGGGVNVSLYSYQGTNGNDANRILINDRSNTNGPALRAYYRLVQPSVTNDGSNIRITYVGTLLTSTDVTLPLNSWSVVPGSSPATIPISSAQPRQFFRALYTQRP